MNPQLAGADTPSTPWTKDPHGQARSGDHLCYMHASFMSAFGRKRSFISVCFRPKADVRLI